MYLSVRKQVYVGVSARAVRLAATWHLVGVQYECNFYSQIWKKEQGVAVQPSDSSRVKQVCSIHWKTHFSKMPAYSPVFLFFLYPQGQIFCWFQAGYMRPLLLRLAFSLLNWRAEHLQAILWAGTSSVFLCSEPARCELASNEHPRSCSCRHTALALEPCQEGRTRLLRLSTVLLRLQSFHLAPGAGSARSRLVGLRAKGGLLCCWRPRLSLCFMYVA